MIRLDIDALELFQGVPNGQNSLVFEGEERGTRFTLNSDLSHSQSLRFYKIINPMESKIIESLYVFNLLPDALVFYCSQPKESFKNKIIVVVDEANKKEVAERLLPTFGGFYPKLHFYHQPEKADLFLFYLELLKLTIYYNIIYISKNLYLNIQYKSISLTLSFRELKRLRYFLNLTDRKFKIKNNVLTKRAVHEIISW